MPQVPEPITSPPPLPWQPYDAADPEEQESQVDAETVYDEVSEGPRANPWRKLADGGAADPSGRSKGYWPPNGQSNTAGPWKNV